MHVHRTLPRASRAFSLVEVLAVVVILGLLAGLMTAGFTGMFNKSKRELAKSGISLIVQRIEAYQIVHSQWPPADLGLDALSDGHAAPTSEYYLSPDKLIDPWGEPYVYIQPGPDGHPYEVLSYGSDRTPGGNDSDADISSTNTNAPTGQHGA